MSIPPHARLPAVLNQLHAALAELATCDVTGGDPLVDPVALLRDALHALPLAIEQDRQGALRTLTLEEAVRQRLDAGDPPMGEAFVGAVTQALGEDPAWVREVLRGVLDTMDKEEYE